MADGWLEKAENSSPAQSEAGFNLIRASVETAFQTYGFSPFHRFGMSDDDPKNLKFIYDEMVELKRSYPRNSFFVISTHKGQLRKREVFLDHFTDQLIESEKQLDLFDNTSPLESSWYTSSLKTDILKKITIVRWALVR